MIWKKMLCTWSLLIVCISVCVATDVTSDTEMKVKESTVTPKADMAMIPDVKASTEQLPTENTMKKGKSLQGDTQRQTVADFIIHPVIAFKPPTPENVVRAASGRQSDATTTTPAPWQLFGIRPGQGLGSLAGTVTGWVNDRIQLLGLVDTPIRETTSTTTTTKRPDIVVRVQQRTTRRPLVSLANNNRPFNNFGFDSNEFEDEEYDYNPPRRYHNRRRFQNNNNFDEEDEDFNSQEYNDNRRGYNQYEEDEEDGDNSQDVEYEEDDQQEENFSQRPNNRRRPIRTNNNRQRPNRQNVRTRPQNDDESDDTFFYNSRPSAKRAQSSTNFIQYGQQSLGNQLRQLTPVQSPAAVIPVITNRPQGALFVNRNGQPVYLAPELAAAAVKPQYQLIANNVPLN